MASRQAERSVSQSYGNRTGYRTKRRKAARPLSPAEKRRMAQFLICGTIFVLLVAVKLLLPGRVTWLETHVGGALERSVNVTEVFSAVGRVFAGDAAEGWQDLYQSVFSPGDEAAIPVGPAGGGAMGGEASGAAVPTSVCPGLISSSNGWLSEAPMAQAPQAAAASERPPEDPSPAREKPAEVQAPPGQADGAQRLSYILYSNRTLPENVSLEQRVLGFDYCTPVMGSLSSDFGYREHPIEGDEKFHYGLDIAADEGTPVACFADGTVTAVGESSSYGKYAIVCHGGDFSTLYAHCSRICASSGAAVKQGQKIAEVGQTGEATGPHLHFELHDGDTYLDPIYYVSLP